MPTEEEFQAFIRQNNDLIRRLMEEQRQNLGADRDRLREEAEIKREQFRETVDSRKEQLKADAEAGRERARAAGEMMHRTAEDARRRTKEAVHQGKETIKDPSIQKHFMAMGMEFAAGMSEIIQKAPMPRFMKDMAGSMERNWKQTACRKNDECASRKAKARKIEIIDVDAKVEDA